MLLKFLWSNMAMLKDETTRFLVIFLKIIETSSINPRTDTKQFYTCCNVTRIVWSRPSEISVIATRNDLKNLLEVLKQIQSSLSNTSNSVSSENVDT